MTEYEARMVALLDQGEIDAKQALDDLQALWKREDEATAANRESILAAHERGARDRAEARKRYTAEDDAEAERVAAEEQARAEYEARLKSEAVAEANAKRGAAKPNR